MIYLGVGVGPFNLGLACLAHSIPIKTIFFDKADDFQWHPGLMISDATLQIPFIADLVSFADPTNPFSFLNYLKDTSRLYQFYIRESMYILRSEYNQYCQWAVSQLSNLYFKHEVVEIEYSPKEKIYQVTVLNKQTNKIHHYFAKNIVLGTGTSPSIPYFCENLPSEKICHSAEYLKFKAQYQKSKSITILGSGQSAAEIFYDLLKDIDSYKYSLNWFTRSPRFYPLEYSKLTLELTSPDYMDYFFHLPPEKRDSLIDSQKNLYKGINLGLINQIYDLMYIKSQDPNNKIRLMSNMELRSVIQSNNSLKLDLHHIEKIILATGYSYIVPKCIKSLSNLIKLDYKGRPDVSLNYCISKENNIFVQNVGLYTHGLVTPDLGMACYRNTVILREITGNIYYPLEKKIAFQEFPIQ